MVDASPDTSRHTLADVLRSHARSRADALAIADGDVHLDWRAFDERVNRAANALAGIGVGRGDRVLWLGQNSFRVQELLLACTKLGAMFCPANWRQQPDELAFVVDDLAPKLVVWQEEEIGDTVRAGRERAKSEARWIQHDVGGPDSYEAFVAGGSPEDLQRDRSSDDAVLMIYTAAFGGRPNAAMLSSRALIAQAVYMAPRSGIDASTVYLNAGPMFHIGVFMTNFQAFVAGGTNVFVRRSDGEALCRAIERERCTTGYILGPMVDAVVDANRDRRFDLSSFRGRRGKPDFDAMVQPDPSDWGGAAGGYGQTEVNGMATFLFIPPRGTGTHGRLSPLVQLRVVDPDDRELPPGEIGEICVRGVTVMNGYWNRPQLNAERSRGGWHHTNDVGRFELDGSFSFVGPKTRMLKSAAENIYPIEVENALRTHAAVADAAIIGVPDEVWVQSVKAIVVVRDGHEVSADELIAHCKERIASYKKPRTVEFVDALPRSGFAVDYDALDAAFGGGGYPGGTTRSV